MPVSIMLNRGDNGPEARVKVFLQELPYPGGETELTCLIDTGASRSVFNIEDLPPGLLSTNVISGVGLTGTSTDLVESKPLKLRLGQQTEIVTKVLVSDTVPTNLLGADILNQILANIDYTPTGVQVVSSLSGEVLNSAC